MNIEDYRDEKSHTVKKLEAENKELRDKNRHLSDQIGDLNVNNLILRAKIRELSEEEYRKL